MGGAIWWSANSDIIDFEDKKREKEREKAAEQCPVEPSPKETCPLQDAKIRSVRGSPDATGTHSLGFSLECIYQCPTKGKKTRSFTFPPPVPAVARTNPKALCAPSITE
jgi:hypothetical protein